MKRSRSPLLQPAAPARDGAASLRVHLHRAVARRVRPVAVLRIRIVPQTAGAPARRPILRILDRYLLSQVGGFFLFGVAIFTTFLTVSDLLGLARMALQLNIPIVTVGRLLVLQLPSFMTLSLPMALLLGALLAFGRLSDRNEIVAMRTSGISLLRVAAPMLIAGIMVAIFTLLIAEGVAPITDERHRVELARIMGRSAIPTENVLFQERSGSQLSVIYARAFGPTPDLLEGLTVNQYDANRLVRVISAARARFAGGRWEFQDGILYLLEPVTIESRFRRLAVQITRTPREIAMSVKDPSQMTIRELQAYIAVLRRAGQSVVRYAVWLHSRMAFPASSIIFALLALPLGLRPHRGGHAIGLGLTIVVLLGYYFLVSAALAVGQAGRMPPMLAAWSPNLIVASIGSYLLWRAQ